MPLLNYTTKVPADKTASEIMSILARKGATDIWTQYDDGRAVGLKWSTKTAHGQLSFELPINTEAVFHVLTKQNVLRTNAQERRTQAERTAWRIVKEWIQAQMALIETEMVQMEEVFLPYMLTGDRTVYQALAERNFLALPPAIQQER